MPSLCTQSVESSQDQEETGVSKLLTGRVFENAHSIFIWAKIHFSFAW